MHNFIAYFQKGGDFLKSYRTKWPHKQVVFFQGRTLKGAESKICTCKFITLVLIRLSHILTYTNHEGSKFQSFHVQTGDDTTHSKGLITFEPGKQCAWTMCYPLSCFSIGWFALQAWLLGKFPPGKKGNTKLGSQITGLARLSHKCKSWFLLLLSKVPCFLLL